VILLAIDPGSAETAWVKIERETGRICGKEIVENDAFRLQLWRREIDGYDRIALEYFQPRGMPTAAEEMDTIFWSGRFIEAAGRDWDKVFRMQEKISICGHGSATDSNISTALRDMYGGQKEAKGLKASPGPLYGFKDDLWAALAIGVTWFRRNGSPEWVPNLEEIRK